MIRVGNFNHHRVNCRQVRGNRYPIIKKTGIIQTTILVVDELFIQRPTNALCDATLDLAFHIGGMDRPADILTGGIAQYFYMPGFPIDFHIDHMCPDDPHVSCRILRNGCHDRTAGRQGLCRDFF